jgi:hypothetical protein
MLHEEEASTFVLNEGTVRSKKQKHGDERRGLGGRWEDGRTALVRQRAARARSSANIGASSVDAPGVHPMGPERQQIVKRMSMNAFNPPCIDIHERPRSLTFS